MSPHLVGETGELAWSLLERAPLHERAAALFAPDVSQIGELPERLPDGNLADLEPCAEAVFRGQLLVGRPAAGFDLVQDERLDLVVEGQRKIAVQNRTILLSL